MGTSQIIAEIGANFCGDMELAKSMIVLAKENGADLVKFQLFSVDNLDRTPEVLEMLRQGELSFEQAKMLFKYGEGNGIEVFFSVFDEERVDWCEQIGVSRYKIAARVVDNALISKIAQTKKPAIVSVSCLYVRDKAWAQPFFDVDLLYCASKYPASIDSLGFNHVDFDFAYQGFSDHTIGLDAAKIAIARGARIIEKHFAIDHKTGVDAPWSMTQNELKELREWDLIVQTCL